MHDSTIADDADALQGSLDDHVHVEAALRRIVKHAAHHGAEALGPGVAERLDALHLRKIDLADWVLVLNVAGYYGESTQREIDYAKETGTPVQMLTPFDLPDGVPGEAEWETWDDVVDWTTEAIRAQIAYTAVQQ